MPEDNASASDDSSKLTRATLISSELEGKLKAISGYDGMLWKVRSGYVAILYGIPAIFLALLILLRLGGFSLSAFIIGKLSCEEAKGIVTRDLLVKSAFGSVVNPQACVNDAE